MTSPSLTPTITPIAPIAPMPAPTEADSAPKAPDPTPIAVVVQQEVKPPAELPGLQKADAVKKTPVVDTKAYTGPTPPAAPPARSSEERRHRPVRGPEDTRYVRTGQEDAPPPFVVKDKTLKETKETKKSPSEYVKIITTGILGLLAALVLLAIIVFAAKAVWSQFTKADDRSLAETRMTARLESLERENEQLKNGAVPDPNEANMAAIEAARLEKEKNSFKSDIESDTKRSDEILERESGKSAGRELLPGEVKVQFEVFDPKKHKARPDQFKAVKHYQATEEPEFDVSKKADKVRTEHGMVSAYPVLTPTGEPLKNSDFIPVLKDKSLTPYSMAVWWESQGEYIEHWFAK